MEHRARTLRRALQRFACLLAVLAALCGGDARTLARTAPAWSGAYDLDEMLTFYVVNDTASNFTVTLHWTNGWQAFSDTPLLVRVLSPDEQVIARWLEPGLRISGTPGWNIFQVPVTATAAGVYQVIVTGFGGSVDFDITPALPWGVYGYPTLAGQNHLQQAYFFVPPGLPALSAQCVGTVNSFQVTDGNGVVHMNFSAPTPRARAPCRRASTRCGASMPRARDLRRDLRLRADHRLPRPGDRPGDPCQRRCPG